MATDRAGNVYVTGALSGTADFDPGPGVVNLTSAGTQDIFVAEYTRAGALVWAHAYGGPGDFDEGKGIAVDDAGDVYATGSFKGTVNFGPGPGTLTLPSAGDEAAFVLKLDGAGNFVWARPFTSHGAIAGDALAVDFAGNVYTTGFFQQTADFDPGPGTFNLTSSPNGNGVFVTKLDTGGNFRWARAFGGGPAADFGYGIAVSRAGDVYTTGIFYGTADFDPGPGTYNLSSDPRSGVEAFVSKLDAGGNFLWAKGFAVTSASGFTSGQGLAVDGTGNVYAAIDLSGAADFDPGPGIFNLTSAGFGDGVLCKLDSGGNFVWARQFTGTSANTNSGVSAVALDGDGNVYATGGFNGTVDFDPGPGTFDLTGTARSGDDIYVAKLDGSGNFLWARQFTGNVMGNGTGIAVDPLGDVYTTGGFVGTADFDPGPGTFNLSSPSGPPSSATFVSQLRDTPAHTPPPPVPSAQNVYVNAAWAGLAPGTDPDGSGPATAIGVDAFAAIQPAVNAAASGGTVRLAAGTYSGPLVLYKRVRLVGSGSANTVLTGQGTGLDITAPGLEISGLTVRGFTTALFARGPAYLALTDMRLSGNTFGAGVSNVQVLLVTGGAGDDTYFVTPSALARQGDNALGYSGVRFLTVDGGGGSNTLNVFLNDTNTADTVWLSAGGIARDKAPFLLFYRASGGTLGGGLVVVLGDAAETVVVQSQLAGAPTTVYAQGGDDAFYVLVSEGSGYANLTLDGGDGSDGVAILDQSGGAVLRDLGPVVGEGVLQVSYPDGAVSRISYQNLEQFLGGLPVSPN